MTKSSTVLASRARTVGIIGLLAIGKIFSGLGFCTVCGDLGVSATKVNAVTSFSFKAEYGKSRACVTVDPFAVGATVQTPNPEKKIPPIANSPITLTARARALQEPCEASALANRARVSHTADPTANSSSQRRQSAALSTDILQAPSP